MATYRSHSGASTPARVSGQPRWPRLLRHQAHCLHHDSRRSHTMQHHGGERRPTPRTCHRVARSHTTGAYCASHATTTQREWVEWPRTAHIQVRQPRHVVQASRDGRASCASKLVACTTTAPAQRRAATQHSVTVVNDAHATYVSPGSAQCSHTTGAHWARHATTQSGSGRSGHVPLTFRCVKPGTCFRPAAMAAPPPPPKSLPKPRQPRRNRRAATQYQYHGGERRPRHTGVTR